jgi:hypothetical protein
MIDLDNYNNIVCSIHLKSDLFNVWDYLSAKWLSLLYNIKNIIWLPDNILSNNWNCIYGWWWMIRPNFYQREVYRHFTWLKWKHSIIWVWINKDIESLFHYTDDDYKALFSWIDSAEYVSVRDNESYNFIKENLYWWTLTREIYINPCPSYIYVKNINKSNNNLFKYKYWIIPSFWHTKWYLPYLNNIENMINEFSELCWNNNLLLLCHDINDLKFSKNKFKSINSVLIKEFEDVIKYYSLCEETITVRAHWIIFSSALWKKCSYVYLADKLKTLYNYHYWINDTSIEPIFNVDYHTNRLKCNIYPINR